MRAQYEPEGQRYVITDDQGKVRAVRQWETSAILHDEQAIQIVNSVLARTHTSNPEVPLEWLLAAEGINP